ncbi:MAG: hypothetical protein M1835_006360 [Candelina submexicana]|nr:MAG: hypothetical protein M1835_006360 [Candelina submexicana]
MYISLLFRMTLKLLGAVLFTFACLQASAATDDPTAKRSRFANTNGDAIGYYEPDAECDDFYGMPDQNHCHLAVDEIPFGKERFDETPASLANIEFLDRHAEHIYLSLPFVRFPQTWTVGSCSVIVQMQQPRDNATWANVIAGGRELIDACVLGHGTGGVQLTGENNNVGVYLYHPTSKFQQYLDATSMLELTYEPNFECSDAESCTGNDHQRGAASARQTPCSSGYSLGPANCCSKYRFSWNSISVAAVALLMGTKQFFPEGIYGWCSLLTETSLSPRGHSVSKYGQGEDAFPAESRTISETQKGLMKTENFPLPAEKSLVRRTASTEMRSLQRPRTDFERTQTGRDKRSRLARPGDRGPVNGRYGQPESPPQCGQVYGRPAPRDCSAAFNGLFPDFPRWISSREVLSLRRFSIWTAGRTTSSTSSGTTFLVPNGGLRGAFGNCVITLQLRDDPDPPVHATSELASWFDVATSFIDVIRDCAEGVGHLGGRQDTVFGLLSTFPILIIRLLTLFGKGQDNLLSVRVYGPSAREYDEAITWCASVGQAVRDSVCNNGKALSNTRVSSPSRPFSPFNGRSCSTGYASVATDCCEAFVFVVEITTIAIARLLWGTFNAIIQYGYCTFVLDILGS